MPRDTKAVVLVGLGALVIRPRLANVLQSADRTKCTSSQVKQMKLDLSPGPNA